MDGDKKTHPWNHLIFSVTGVLFDLVQEDNEIARKTLVIRLNKYEVSENRQVI